MNCGKRQVFGGHCRSSLGVLSTRGKQNQFCFWLQTFEHVNGIFERVKKVKVDMGYDRHFMEVVKAMGIEAEISSKPPTQRGFVSIQVTLAWGTVFISVDIKVNQEVLSLTEFPAFK